MVLLMNQRPSKFMRAGYAVRRATLADAQAISALYVRVYTPAGGADARDYYPFPQIMSPDAVAEMIAGGRVVWFVGEASDGTLVGSAAAVRNIGDARDQIAEVFGVVVDAAERDAGLGTALVSGLVKELASTAEFILCEARTAEAGGWKVARNSGFRPVGYEPYAHSMPVGFESMVLTGRWRSSHLDGRDCETSPTKQVRRLQEAIVGQTSAGDVRQAPMDRAQQQNALPSGVNVRRDDVAGRWWFDGPAAMFDRSAGIVGLNPLQGVDHRNGRFTDACYVALSASSELGAARVFYDRVDARARILGLRAVFPRVRAALLDYLVKDLLQVAGDDRLVIIVLVSSDSSEAQAELASLGFFPTVYLPMFIATGSGRSNVVQYTRLVACSLSESTNAVTAKDWPEAEKVIAQVLRFAP